MQEEFIVSEVSWNDACDLLKQVREKVFVLEQRVSTQIEIDGRDPVCYHVLVKTKQGEPIGTGRLSPEGKIGRVSVLMPYRGLGLGSKILQALLNIADREQLSPVKLHAQIQAIDFYERHQFVANGPVFMEAGIPHQTMKRYSSQP
ncbi:GNAT family N-acetyltransferase [Pleionea sediminis]|uniref:GNAT family N-acetyltransferase n=1 Tax=Pleionea sediminis TaxID=2569479 RepID=UPI0011863688|nr:GNAT family N-acetyltransferase [Pleionea sediminis]